MMSTRPRLHNVLGTLAVLLALLVTPLLATGSRSRSGTRSHVRSSSTASTRSRSGSGTRAHAPRTLRASATSRTAKSRPTPSKPTPQARPRSVSPLLSRNASGHIRRSEAVKRTFMRQTGYPRGRLGYVVDHIKPLACGGSDAPSNMQWQTAAAAKAKDRVERRGCR